MADHMAGAGPRGINWGVRVANRDFWLALIPATLLLAQALAAPFGYDWDFGVLNQQAAAIVNALFAVLALLGVVNDPTTATLADSERALGYGEPSRG